MLALYSRFEAFIWKWLIKPFLALLVARYVYAFLLWVFKVDPGLWLATSLPGPTTHGLIEIGRWSVVGAPALMLLMMHEARRRSEFYAEQRNSIVYQVRPQSRPKPVVKRAAPVVPDRPISFLFQHVHPAPFRTFLEKERVGKQVIEKFASGALRVWGREIVDSKRMPLAEIPKEAWRSSRFTYWFLDGGGEASRDICHMECDGPQRAPRLYCDLQVNRIQLETVWPRRASH